MQTRQHIEKLIRVSQMYYDEGLNQSQIAGEVGYSRSSVSRMLTDAPIHCQVFGRVVLGR